MAKDNIKTKTAIFLIRKGMPRERGLAYVEKLRKKQNILEVIEEKSRLVIVMEDK